MDGKTKLKLVGLLLLVVCVCSAFFAYERYQANAERPENKVASAVANAATQLMGAKAEKPEVKMPVETKYGILAAVVSGIVGVGLLFKVK